MNGGLLAVKMDSRRLIPNVVSMFVSEVEFLAPLIIFPDEVLYYSEESMSDDELRALQEEIHKKYGGPVWNTEVELNYRNTGFESLKDFFKFGHGTTLFVGISIEDTMRKIFFLFFMTLMIFAPAKTWAAFGGQEIIDTVINTINQSTLKHSDFPNGAVAEKVALISNDSHTELVPEMTENGVRYIFRYDNVALKNPSLLLKDLSLLVAVNTRVHSHIFHFGTFKSDLVTELNSAYSLAETWLNARMGSPTAQLRLAQVQLEIIQNAYVNPIVAEDLGVARDVLLKDAAKLGETITRLEEVARRHIRKQTQALEKWKSETGTLDKLEAMDEKLNDLILNNDRKRCSSIVRCLFTVGFDGAS